jgi:hypothetical protein
LLHFHQGIAPEAKMVFSSGHVQYNEQAQRNK